MAFSPDGRYLASLGWLTGFTLRVFDLDAGTNHTLASQADQQERIGFGQPAFHPDGKSLVAGGLQEIVQWDVTTWEKRTAPTGHAGWVGQLTFSPDGNTLAGVYGDEKGASVIRLWKVTRKE